MLDANTAKQALETMSKSPRGDQSLTLLGGPQAFSSVGGRDRGLLGKIIIAFVFLLRGVLSMSTTRAVIKLTTAFFVGVNG